MTQLLIIYLHTFTEHWASAGDNNNNNKIVTICAGLCQVPFLISLFVTTIL